MYTLKLIYSLRAPPIGFAAIAILFGFSSSNFQLLCLWRTIFEIMLMFQYVNFSFSEKVRGSQRCTMESPLGWWRGLGSNPGCTAPEPQELWASGPSAVR